MLVRYAGSGREGSRGVELRLQLHDEPVGGEAAGSVQGVVGVAPLQAVREGTRPSGTARRSSPDVTLWISFLERLRYQRSATSVKDDRKWAGGACAEAAVRQHRRQGPQA